LRTPPKAEVTFPGDAEVRVTRQFFAPRAVVYRAYTEPDLMKRWLLGPPGWSMPVCEMDLEVGGKFRWRWRNDEDGKKFGFYGEFLDIRDDARIVHSQHYDPGDVGGEMGEGIAHLLLPPQHGLGHQHPDGRMGVLPAILPQARQITLDVARIHGRGIERRREQQDQLFVMSYQLPLDGLHGLQRACRRGGPGKDRPALRQRINAALGVAA
jgi:uncharacterized protein YndB with AHSA1/START domain